MNIDWASKINIFFKENKFSDEAKRKIQESFKVIEIATLSDALQTVPSLDKFLVGFKPEMHRCYLNSWECAKAIEGVGYVEGFIHAKVGELSQFTSHAWCIYKGMYFDITPKKEREGSAIITVSYKDVANILEITHESLKQYDDVFNNRSKQMFACVFYI